MSGRNVDGSLPGKRSPAVSGTSAAGERRCPLSTDEWFRICDGLRLSARECEIVHGVLENCSEAHIALNLRISVHTVHSHFERLYRKLRVRSRAELVLRVFEEYVLIQRTAGQERAIPFTPPLSVRPSRSDRPLLNVAVLNDVEERGLRALDAIAHNTIVVVPARHGTGCSRVGEALCAHVYLDVACPAARAASPHPLANTVRVIARARLLAQVAAMHPASPGGARGHENTHHQCAHASQELSENCSATKCACDEACRFGLHWSLPVMNIRGQKDRSL